ncbi:carbon-nitrogen family hydrolase [Macrococcoides caseolyticum]|uniref:carbon-nitrogen family hydrolase n=1 Tax=Macrococcoides caseolyticum TaxID=69966 RepID=UPI001F1E7C90|nr:carbon-nitrogen family hydrolase [Macrococcus caseolyticus]MCE4957449.1 carbon-nitrogen family hydrolase [Macrococcus caseolyticus]
MKIAIYQMEVIPGNPDKNIEKIKKWMQTLENIDIAVLPEMWNTSYTLEALHNITSENGEREIKALQQCAKQFQIHIVAGSIAVKDGNNIYNRAIVINRRGAVVHLYDKVHLVPMLNEPAFLTQGNKVNLFELDGKKMGIIICYDLRFPEIARMLTLKGIEVLFVVAQWPEERIAQYEKLLYARAIENQLFVVACNAVGQCNQTVFGGRSMVINPLGDAITPLLSGEGALETQIDLNEVRDIRASIPLLTTRRIDLY